MILTADVHLTDKPEDAYRWKVFDQLKANSDGQIFILGDLTDKADRHSSVLVNMLVEALSDLSIHSEVTIIMGNHDRCLKGPSYFSFLNSLPRIKFLTEPTSMGDLLLLPYSHNPREDWKEISFNKFKCAMIHQTVKGATLKPGVIADSDNLPPLPEKLIVYAGDLHIPHIINNVTYVGAPHAVKFGDTYRCRLLKLDKNYQIEKEIILRRMNKKIIEVSSLEELQAIRAAPGDQARIRFTLPSGKMEQWPIQQEEIAEWARSRGVQLASIEAIVEISPDKTAIEQINFNDDPESVLEMFCRAEGVDEEIYQTGLTLLKGCVNV